MSNRLICDICNEGIAIGLGKHHRLTIDEDAPIDICGTCYDSAVVLSERRRDRVIRRRKSRKVKAAEAAVGA
jgi:hypothetical protein